LPVEGGIGRLTRRAPLMPEASDTSVFSSQLEVVTGVCLEEKTGRPSDRMVLKISKRFLRFLVASYSAPNASASGTQ